MIPIVEIPGQIGPDATLFGLDEMTRYFMGSRENYDAWLLTHLPGTYDFEYPWMSVLKVTPSDTETGDIIKISVSYVGSRTNPNEKQPEVSMDVIPANETITATAYRSTEVLEEYTGPSGGQLYFVYNTWRHQNTGKYIIEYDTYRVTFNYISNSDSPDYLFEALATQKLASKNLNVRYSRFIPDTAWPPDQKYADSYIPNASLASINGFFGMPKKRNQKINFYPDVNSITVPKRITKAGLNSQQRGNFFEVSESWQLSIDTTELDSASQDIQKYPY